MRQHKSYSLFGRSTMVSSRVFSHTHTFKNLDKGVTSSGAEFCGCFRIFFLQKFTWKEHIRKSCWIAYPFTIKDSVPRAQIFLYFIVSWKFNLKVIFNIWCRIFWIRRNLEDWLKQIYSHKYLQREKSSLTVLHCIDTGTTRRTNFRPTCYLCQKKKKKKQRKKQRKNQQKAQLL